MSKRAAIAKATGVASHAGASEHRLFQIEAATALTKHLVDSISSVSGARRTKPSRSACSQLALQVLVLAAGLRRAALVDALGLSSVQASAVSSRLVALSKQQSLPGSSDLRHVRLLYHAATGQTFVVSTQQSLWADMSTLDTAAGHRLWIDARWDPKHTEPTRTSPDSHVIRLLERVCQAVLADDSGDVLVVLRSLSDSTRAQGNDQVDARIVGVALAGFLLEYGAVYCLHNGAATDAAPDHQVHPLRLVETPLPEPDFAPSPPNCLGSQPLILFQVHWHDVFDTSCELLSFSIPQSLTTVEEVERAHLSLKNIFQTRVDRASSRSIFAHGRISVQVTTVTLPQVSL